MTSPSGPGADPASAPDLGEITVSRWSGDDADGPGPAGLLAAYHLRTEAEKGAPVDDVAGLPDRYRAEVLDPAAVFAQDVVLVASSAGTAVGCLILTAPAERRSEIKRLWADPEFRGRGIASGLVETALRYAAGHGADTVALSVWKWRTGAIGLYGRLGFVAVESWDERGQLLCMERSL
ncbi:GNAT family N-acetyltransferase [Streptomyces sp. CA-111067]|uniref:GNAT family N-acetyltransferase n=1 Tax=Streptomyces sp. CA-111067 TaxID=3240046 RepID=UPI003D984082